METPGKTSQLLGHRLDTYLADLHKAGQWSGTVMITQHDEVILSNGYGHADLEHRVANTPQTRFRIGSITKQFTAMAILILQEQSKLRVQEPVGRYLSEIPPAWQQLSIHQLLTHTSGIVHSWALPGFTDIMMIPASLDEALARFYDEPLLFAPGEGFTYSGVGYFLLAKLIETLSGQPYDTFLQQEILTPLGLHDTGCDQPEGILASRARGYVLDDETLHNAPAIYMPILTGGGNLYSTSEDLARWDHALRKQRLLSAAGYEAFYRPALENYAYGWRVGEKGDRCVLSHSGAVPGFRAFLLRIPEEELCVVVLANWQHTAVREIADRLAEETLGCA